MEKVFEYITYAQWLVYTRIMNATREYPFEYPVFSDVSIRAYIDYMDYRRAEYLAT